jgi:ATP-dependent 26S proteasome regulatory subunit
MFNKRDVRVEGIPDFLPSPAAEACKAELVDAVNRLLDASGVEDLSVIVSTVPPASASRKSGRIKPPVIQERVSDELSIAERALQYQARPPLFAFDFLTVPEEVMDVLLSAVDLVRLEQKVFDEWNLRRIEPFPRTALNFYGQPGTGKTLAAHALASHLGKTILPASYAQIESKFLGDGPKNIEALFFAAARDKAVLFIDEADSLLSKRLTNVTQGSEQATNSMRSQLLVCLEQFRGVVIFSTNLIESYDRAFETRLRHVHFPMPDEASRREIWRKHLPEQLPLEGNVSLDRLAAIDEICGRDIKNAVIDAALRVARADRKTVRMEDLEKALDRIKTERQAIHQES